MSADSQNLVSRLLGKQLFLIVSPSTGNLKRLRITLGGILVLVCATFLVLASFGFVAGDYTRVQVERVKSYVKAQRLGIEKQELASHNEQLKKQVNKLERQKSRVQGLEQDVRQQLAQLKDVMAVASRLGVLPEKTDTKLAMSPNNRGIGGAELDCIISDKNCQKDNATNKQHFGYRPSSFRSSTIEQGLNSDLVDQLAYYTAALKVVPLGAPVSGKISSGFGHRQSPFSKKIRLHQGVDFSLPYGTKVWVTANGTVVNVKRDATYGIMVDVKHSNNVVTRYAHLSKAGVVKGQKMKRGDLIGLIGSTGRSTGPHLHYEVRVKDKAVNPFELISLPKRFQGLA